MHHVYGVHNLLMFLVIGVVAGWLAGLLTRGNGFGLVGNLVVGILGAIVGGYLFDFLGIYTYGILSTIIMASIGAVVLLFLIGLLKK
jgi:uncharacterized membrane protein YeaQ/YmgE (transglycosylase-associated protein family)